MVTYDHGFIGCVGWNLALLWRILASRRSRFPLGKREQRECLADREESAGLHLPCFRHADFCIYCTIHPCDHF